jgi:hypothetical protein
VVEGFDAGAHDAYLVFLVITVVVGTAAVLLAPGDRR